MRPALAVCLALACPLAAACGKNRPDPVEPGEQLERQREVTPFRDARAGLEIELPRPFARRRPPGVVRVALPSGDFASIWAYRRREPVPKGRAELRAARKRLVKAVEQRSKTYKLRNSKVSRVAGAPAIELVGDQTLSKGRLRARSVHVFKGKGEYVLELFAEPSNFPTADRVVFAPMLRSLEITGKIRR